MVDIVPPMPPISQMKSGTFWVRDGMLFSAEDGRAYRSGQLSPSRADELTVAIFNARNALAAAEVDHVKWHQSHRRNLI